MNNYLIQLLAHSIEVASEGHNNVPEPSIWMLTLGFLAFMFGGIGCLCLQSSAHRASFGKFRYLEKVNRKEHAARRKKGK